MVSMPFPQRVDRPGEVGPLALEEDLAVVRLIDAGDALDQRRLAGAVVAEQRDHLAGIDVPAHVVDGDQAAEALGQVADRKDRIAHLASALGPADDQVARLVDQHGDDDDDADDDELPEGLDVEHHQSGGQHRDDQRADHRADDRAGAAEEADAADDDRGDRGEEQRVADDRRAGGEAERRQEAGDAGGHRREDVEHDDVAIDRDAGAERRLHVAADGVGVATELGLSQKEHGDGDDDCGDHDRIGEDAVHAAQHLAGQFRRREEIEAAALAADRVEQRFVAVGANAFRQPDHGGVLRHQQRDAAHDEGGAEGDDEGRHLQLGDDRAVDQADETGADHGGERSR